MTDEEALDPSSELLGKGNSEMQEITKLSEGHLIEADVVHPKSSSVTDDGPHLGINLPNASQTRRRRVIFKSSDSVAESPLRRNTPRGKYALPSTRLWPNLITQ